MTAGASQPRTHTAPAPHRVLMVALDAEVGSDTYDLIRLLRSMHESGTDVELLLWRHGPLLEQLRSVCRVRVVDHLTESGVSRALRGVGLTRVANKLTGLRLRLWLRESARRSPTVLVRGVRAAKVLSSLPEGTPAVVELGQEERPGSRVDEHQWTMVRRRATGFIVPDDDARAALEADGVPADRVRVCAAGRHPEAPAESAAVKAEELPDRVFVIALDADRGADTYYLLRMLRWMREAGIEVELLLWRHGPLLDELREVCRVRVVDHLTESVVDRVLRMVGLTPVANKVTGLRLRVWLRGSTRRSPTVLVRGLTAAKVLHSVPSGTPAVVHVLDQERPSVLASEAQWKMIRDHATAFIVADDEARDALVAGGVAPNRVQVEDGFFAGTERPATELIEGTLVDEPTRSARRRALGIPDEALLICGSGTDDWWRAPEPFVAVAWAVSRRLPDRDIRFLWLCHDLEDEDGLWPLRHDIGNAGMGDRFLLAEAGALCEQLALSDLVLLTGRPDTFSLLTYDLRLAARPVACFRNGAAEQSLGDAATVVDYLDVEALAGAVVALLEDPAALKALTERAVARSRLQDAAGDVLQWLVATAALSERAWGEGVRSHGSPDRLLQSVAELSA